jgi:Uma2 family endonuclease
MTVVPEVDPDQQQHIVLDDVSWEFYEHLLEEIGDRPVRVTYCDGRIEIMSPLPKHDRWGFRIARLISDLCVERNIAYVPGGSTTFKSKLKKIGLEPDGCFYLTNCEIANQIDGPFDDSIHPPPDLAVEIDITRRSIDKEPIYAALHIREIWRFDGTQLYVKVLQSDETYRVQPTSAAFPFLPVDQFLAFVLRFKIENDTVVIRQFQQWVRSLHA